METGNSPKPDSNEIWFAKTDSVKVTHEKSPTSKLVHTLNRGEALKVLEKSKTRYKVELEDGKIGWTAKSKLTQSNPSEQFESLKSLTALTDQSSITVDESRTGGSIRG